MTWYRRGYIDGLQRKVQRYVFKSLKAYRKYNRGYAKGCGTWYYRALMRLTADA